MILQTYELTRHPKELKYSVRFDSSDPNVVVRSIYISKTWAGILQKLNSITCEVTATEIKFTGNY